MSETTNFIGKIGTEESILPWMGRTSKLMFIYLKQELELADINLTLKQWIVLRHLLEEDSIDQKNLAIITERDKTSLTRLISTMEKKGLLVRIKSHRDKRVNLLQITEQGRSAFNSALPVLKASTEKLVHGITEHELGAAIETIKKINFNIKELTDTNG